jgi:hypothetical protein
LPFWFFFGILRELSVSIRNYTGSDHKIEIREESINISKCSPAIGKSAAWRGMGAKKGKNKGAAACSR